MKYNKLRNFGNDELSMKFNVEEQVKLFSLCVDFRNAMKKTIKNLMQINKDTDFVQELDILFDCSDLADLDIKVIKEFEMTMSSSSMAVNRRLRDALQGLGDTKEQINNAIQGYIIMPSEKRVKCINELKVALGHFSTFMIQLFELDECSTEETSFVVAEYCKLKGYDVTKYPVELATDCALDIKEYKPNMAVFDIYPELEDAFVEKAPAFYYDASFLTYAQIKSVIDDEVSEEQLEEMIEKCLEERTTRA